MLDIENRVRFQENKVVRFLYDWASSRGMSMNELSLVPFPAGDREQFAQLIGYSLCGFSELIYVRDATYERAIERAKILKGGS